MPVELLVALGFAVLGQTTYSSSPGNTTRRSSRVFNALFRVHADGTAICSVRKDELYAYAVPWCPKTRPAWSRTTRFGSSSLPRPNEVFFEVVE